MGLIYKYKNLINGKEYVGQTIRRLSARDWQHCHPEKYAKKENQYSYIDNAILKYGRDNFELTILEDNIPNEVLDEKEQYYISKYDTYRNGYNLTPGGQNNKKIPQNTIDEIISLIKDSKMTFKEIGEKVGYSVWFISDINTGKSYKQDNENYPIRFCPITYKYSEEVVFQVIEMLQTTDLTFEEIAILSDTNFYFVCDVNRGKRKVENNKIYNFPLRKNSKYTVLNEELFDMIIHLLMETKLSQEEIGNSLGISPFTVGQINRGKSAYCKQHPENSYPIRKLPGKFVGSNILSEEDVENIVFDLIFSKNTLEEIGKRYGIARNTVGDISRGISWKEITGLFEKPIRQKAEKNKQIYNEIYGIV